MFGTTIHWLDHSRIGARRSAWMSSSPILRLAAWRRTASSPTFPPSSAPAQTADLFLVLLMKLLKPGGRAGTRAARRNISSAKASRLASKRSPPHRVQPPHHRPPAQWRLQSLHRHPHQPPLLHQGRTHHPRLVLRAPLSARRQELQQRQTHPHRGVRGRARLVGR